MSILARPTTTRDLLEACLPPDSRGSLLQPSHSQEEQSGESALKVAKKSLPKGGQSGEGGLEVMTSEEREKELGLEQGHLPNFLAKRPKVLSIVNM